MISAVQEIIEFYYCGSPALKALLLEHSLSVWEKARSIAASGGADLDLELLEAGCYLHDLGIIRCDAPAIGCYGKEPYLKHGLLGGEMLRSYNSCKCSVPHCQALCRICENHIGSGLCAGEISANALPLPVRDFLPESPEEKLICLADNFFSKSGDRKEKTLSQVRRKMAKFGTPSLERFDDLCHLFDLS